MYNLFLRYSIVHRVFFFLSISFIIPQKISAQLDDIGLSVDRNPVFSSRDSLNFLIVEGESPLIDQAIEGAAIEFIGDNIESVLFIVNDGNNDITINGNLFSQPNDGSVIATFLKDLKSLPFSFSYKVVAVGSIDINSIIIFPIEDELPGLAKKMEIVSGAIPKPTIISREEWGAEDSKGAYSYHPYFDKLTLHHAACCSADDLEEGKNQVYWIQDFHQNGRGWNDIGYHFLVDRVGNIYQGRPETVIGAHVGGANTGNIGVCLLGCYHPPETSYSCTQEITPESREAIVRLFSWISDTYGQNPSLLLGHRDYFGTTSCPGDNVWIELPRYRAEIFSFIQDYFEIPPISIFKDPYPNPFFNAVTFSFELKDKMDFKMNIYDILGRKVNMVERVDASSGRLEFVWDGKDLNGKKLGSGVYFAKPSPSDDIEPIKMILLKK